MKYVSSASWSAINLFALGLLKEFSIADTQFKYPILNFKDDNEYSRIIFLRNWKQMIVFERYKLQTKYSLR